jgi:ADP-dependent NAD(P)H-hydrate dehydratase / NAD(P)H-hydrate epimerase
MILGLGPIMSFTLQLSTGGVLECPILRSPDGAAHKYNRGHAIIISGPALATGASRLSAQAALAVGAGLVSLVGDEAALCEHACHVTGIMLKKRDASLSVIDDRVRSIAVGPAAGVGTATREAVLQVLARQIPTVLDADALSSFSAERIAFFAALHSQSVLTPHAGEFARLWPEISLADRMEAATLAAKTSGAVVLLKGAETVIAAPDGRQAINRHSTSWLATAGSGDVLTGLICGIMAQGVESFAAACIAAWLHGDIGVRHGPGLIADNMCQLLPIILADCLEP